MIISGFSQNLEGSLWRWCLARVLWFNSLDVNLLDDLLNGEVQHCGCWIVVIVMLWVFYDKNWIILFFASNIIIGI